MDTKRQNEKYQEWEEREQLLTSQKSEANRFMIFGLIMTGIVLILGVIPLHKVEQWQEIVILLLVLGTMICILFRVFTPLFEIDAAYTALIREKRHIHADTCTLHGAVILLDNKIRVGGYGSWGGAHVSSELIWERTQCTECHSITFYDHKTHSTHEESSQS